MERHQIIDAMTGLKLYGMRASFDEIAGKGLARRDELYPLLGSLIRAELAHRQSRSINYRISGARFPVLKDLEAFIFEGSPVDEVQIRELAAGDFIDAKRNLILIGGTGTENSPRDRDRRHGHPRQSARTLFQSRRSRQSTRTGKSCRKERPHRRGLASSRPHHHRRTRLSAV